MGMAHPNPDVPAMAMATSALALSEELGLSDNSVHFNMGWVPYDRRQDFLLESDVGVSTHFDHLETTFSFRTRIPRLHLGGLPVVSTEGDELAPWIAETATGRVVAFEDPGSISSALISLLKDRMHRQAAADAVRRAQPDFTWDAALAPLVSYCEEPWVAADHAAGRRRSNLSEADAQYALGSMMAPQGLLPRMRFFLQRRGQRPRRRPARAARRRLAGDSR